MVCMILPAVSFSPGGTHLSYSFSAARPSYNPYICLFRTQVHKHTDLASNAEEMGAEASKPQYGVKLRVIGAG